MILLVTRNEDGSLVSIDYLDTSGVARTAHAGGIELTVEYAQEDLDVPVYMPPWYATAMARLKGVPAPQRTANVAVDSRYLVDGHEVHPFVYHRVDAIGQELAGPR